MTQALPRCSDAARARLDAPVGTAAPAQRWLLIEHPGPWHREALASSGVAHPVLESLTKAVAAGRGRILLVRRPGRAVSGGLRSWAVVDSAAPGTSPVWGVWEHDRDLLDAIPLLRQPLPVSSGTSADPLLLVCAHGRHDVCCAVRGRPVAAALAERWPAQTWECSHVGGDRFAANLVVLPDGVFYGNLDAASAVAVVEGHHRGETDLDHFRGLSTEPPVGQVAVAAALARYAPAAPRAFATTSMREVAAHRWSVVLAGAGPLPDLEVVVVTSARPSARLTCAAVRYTAAVAYDVVSVTVRDG